MASTDPKQGGGFLASIAASFSNLTKSVNGYNNRFLLIFGYFIFFLIFFNYCSDLGTEFDFFFDNSGRN